MLALLRNSVSNREGMLDHLLDVFWPDGVEDVEGVLAVRLTALGIVVGEVDEDFRVLLDEGPDLLDGDLVELGHVDRPKLRHLDELLLVRKDLLKEVLVDHRLRGNIELDYNAGDHGGTGTYDILRSSG